MINSGNWKIKLALKNESDGSINISIDQLSVEIFYTPLYTLCKQDCGIAFVEEDGSGYDYNWILPEGMEITSQYENHHIINFMMTDRNYGVKEICVEITAPGGDKLTLCRDILFINCTPAIIGDYVWFDEDGNALQDASEEGLEGVTMVLYKGSGEALDTVVSDIDGFYHFFDVPPGDYYVESQYDGGLIPSNVNVGGDTLPDNAFSWIGNKLRTNVFSLDFDQIYEEADLGLMPAGSIGDLVWLDLNANGTQDPGESGMEGVQVLLFNESVLVDSIITDINGNYFFEKLYPGNYQICVEFPEEAEASPESTGSEDLDSDINEDGCSALISLALGEDIIDVDAGLYFYGTIGDFVWDDLDEDGIQNDGNNSGIVGMTIKLYDSETDDLLQFAFSNGQGHYLFENLVPGSYYVTYETGLPIQPTQEFAGSDVALDSDAYRDGDIFRTQDISIGSGDLRTDIDAGFVLLKSGIGNFVWLDQNEDGPQDVDEPGVNGIEIQLYDGLANLINTTFSEDGPDGKAGYFAFETLVPGEYYIQVNIPDLYVFTIINNSDYSLNSVIDGQNGPASSGTITLQPDDYNIDQDVGLVYNYASLGDYVWLDLNEDGIQDDTEYGITDVKLYLFDENDVVRDSTVTAVSPENGEDGFYQFEKVIPGMYYLVLGHLETSYESTVKDAGTEDKDSDFDLQNGLIRSDIFELQSGEQNDQLDAGLLLKNASISGLAWFDEDENGLRESSEILLTGIKIELFNAVGTLINTQFSGLAGSYNFTGLSLGDYYLVFDINDVRLFTFPQEGDPQLDSDVTGANGAGSTDLIQLALSEIRPDIDAGYVHDYGSVGDFVWLDLNEDGLQDTTENGLNDIKVYLFDENNLVQDSTITAFSQENATDGYYLFEIVIPGNYYLEFLFPDKYDVSPDGAGDGTNDADITGANGNNTTNLFALAGGENQTDLDAGLTGKPIFFGDFVWLDVNRNGLQDSGEGGLNGMEIFLKDNNGMIIQTTFSENNINTGEAGYYLFETKDPGDYYIELSIPSVYLSTIPDAGPDDVDSDITENFGTGSTALYSVDYSDSYLDIDLGLVYKTAGVGNYIWKDLDENGIQDDGLTGIDDLLVNLFDQNDQLIASTQTATINDTSGIYVFSNVNPGSYYIETHLTQNLEPTLLNIGDEILDSDLAEIDQRYRSEVFVLGPDENLTTIDFGLIDKRGVIEGLVWYDENEDGFLNNGEAGLEAIEVRLFDEDGFLKGTDISSVDGAFNFTEVKPSAYYLQFVFGDAFEATIFQAGTDINIDSDINSAIEYGSTPVFTINPGDIINNVFGGLIDKPLLLGDYVWVDDNKDGRQDTEESGLNGIDVRLYDSSGQFLEETQSTYNAKDDFDGYYAFRNVPEGMYYIRFIMPQGYLASPADVGANDEKDSDVLNLFGEGTTDTFYYSGTEDILNIDAGFYFDVFSSIGDYVWLDKNGDGIQDATETGLNDISLELYKKNGDYVASTISSNKPISGEAGYYLFDGIGAGEYYVKVNLPDSLYLTKAKQGVDQEIDCDINHSNGSNTSDLIDISSNQNETGIDIGLFELGIIGDFVWDDSNSNGFQDEDEEGVNDVLVELFDNDENLIASTNTVINGESGNSGFYEFQSVDPGEYFLKFHVDPNAEFSLFNAADNAFDSDVTGAFGFGTTSLFSVKSKEERLDIDAGISLEGGDINGLIWLDLNADGLYENSEDGLNAMVVKLMREDGTQASEILSYNDVSTETDGYYEFINVPDGSYYLEIVKPDDYLFTEANVGLDDALDSEIDDSFGQGTSASFTIVNDMAIDSFNAGIYIPASIGDYVWHDADQDGLQDVDEEGAVGVDVILLKNGAIPVETVSTDEDGKYTFTGLQQGVYAVLFRVPEDYGFTERNIGNDDAIDSDAASNGKSSLISLAHGAKYKDLDAGLIPLSNLVGNQIWYDSNSNGVWNDDEEAITGAKVYLYNNSDVLYDETISDEFGEYIFYNLKPGSYYVKVVRNESEDGQGNRYNENELYPNERQTPLFFMDYDSFLEDKDIGFQPFPWTEYASKDENHLLIYPNPFQTTIRIDLTGLSLRPDEVIITDMMGNIVTKQRIGPFGKNVYLNLAHLPTDNYMVNMMKSKKLLVRKMIYKAEK